ncbi:phage portal protein [Paracoccus sp. DMF-8]|uniref:phage portal protein n=1 Tax=Paracoccus sp. DMF-8 TaxID=3019445 RepID=UPI0023E8F65A|nr:phage portal protein [Paracoccus sp. DMF-8]MDF3606550.1 phage portal protein [Paracoccus sp. DMF-8]
MRGGRSIAPNRWRPSLAEADDQVAAAWEIAAARSADAIINSGWLSGAIEQAAANTVGVGMRLKAIPENSLFGMSDKAAQEWGTMVERHFGIWASNPAVFDIEGRRSFGQMQDAVFRSSLATGEMLSEVAWRVRPGIRERTKIRALPPMRLQRDSDPMRGLNTGVFQDVDGLPVGYLTYRRDRMGVQHDHTVAARDQLGRRLVGHFFDGRLGRCAGSAHWCRSCRCFGSSTSFRTPRLPDRSSRRFGRPPSKAKCRRWMSWQGLVTAEEKACRPARWGAAVRPRISDGHVCRVLRGGAP